MHAGGEAFGGGGVGFGVLVGLRRAPSAWQGERWLCSDMLAEVAVGVAEEW